MKFEHPINPNYAAVVVKLGAIIPLPNCDNVVATSIFGFQAIVGKDSKPGDIGVVFPAETQLSEQFCRENNMFRHKEQNKDQTQGGYIEDNRRVKAVKFRGHTSSCLFMPLKSLSYILSAKEINILLEEGDTFDTIHGTEICKKYEVPRRAGRTMQEVPKKFSRVDKKFMPEHYDTENYFRNDRNIAPETEIIITQKVHGTSIRIGNTVVARSLGLLERIARRLGVRVQETETDYVFGSRKVIKDANNPNQVHYYDVDLWSSEGKKLMGMIPENFLVYAELIGFTTEGKAIQHGYTYDLTGTECALFIYRVAFVNGQGLVTDLAWEQVKTFCKERGLKHVPELWRGKHADFKVADFIDKRFSDHFDVAIKLSGKDTVDEGVCIRIDGMIPLIYKAKSPLFLEHESKMLDQQAEDLEAQGV